MTFQVYILFMRCKRTYVLNYTKVIVNRILNQINLTSYHKYSNSKFEIPNYDQSKEPPDSSNNPR